MNTLTILTLRPLCISLRLGHLASGVLLWLVSIGIFASPALAQDTTLTRLIRQHQRPLTPKGQQLTGTGWDQLRSSISQSRLVLVGEDHGLAEVPLFVAAVAREFQPSVFATEIDPYVAHDLSRLVAVPGPPTAYLQQYPEGLCFYNWTEEYELARTLWAQKARILGLDQVFITTAGPFYTHLAQQVTGAAAKTYLQQQAGRYRAQWQALEREGMGKAAMATQSPAAIDSLLTLTRPESPAVRQMVADYVASYQIYQAQMRGTGGHQERLNLLKRNLLNYLQPYQATPVGVVPALPKMLFKFGAFHLGRGLSPAPFGEYYDLGNLVQNLADSHDVKSLHIMILAKQGTQAIGANQTKGATNSAPLTPADNAYLKLFFDQTTGPAWNVVDLRPARHALTAGTLRVSSPTLERTLLGYDYLVIIPEATASHSL